MADNSVLVGMSGGVDSAVTAWTLLQEGYDVRAVVLRLWEEDPARNETKIWSERTCCHVPMVQYLCDRILQIPCDIVDVSREFQDHVVTPFRDGYSRGETPNPCTTCNAEIKINHLLSIAQSRGIGKIATGHYAGWQYSEDFSCTGLLLARDTPKDQSYFLARTRGIGPDNCLLPLGKRLKGEVREIALNAGFPLSGMLENQEACFVSEKRVREFLEKDIHAETPGEWTAIDEDQNLLGTIRNGIGLTRGQRRGVGISGGERRYVLSVNPGEKKVTLSTKDRLFDRGFSIRSPMGPLFERKESGNIPPLFVRFRSTMRPVLCAPADTLLEKFLLDQPHDGIVAGQVASFSDRTGVLVGSGILSREND